jgi:DNA-binding Lrp family transcriptional regulator
VAIRLAQLLLSATKILIVGIEGFGVVMSEKRTIGAYVLIKIAPGKSRSITEKISRVEGVKTAHPVTGMFDIIAFVEASDINNLTGTVRSKIQTIDGVLRTHTAIVGEFMTASA